MGISMLVSIVGTIIVLILTIITITKGYGYKHTIDELPEEEDKNSNRQTQKQYEGDTK